MASAGHHPFLGESTPQCPHCHEDKETSSSEEPKTNSVEDGTRSCREADSVSSEARFKQNPLLSPLDSCTDDMVSETDGEMVTSCTDVTSSHSSVIEAEASIEEEVMSFESARSLHCFSDRQQKAGDINNDDVKSSETAVSSPHLSVCQQLSTDTKAAYIIPKGGEYLRRSCDYTSRSTKDDVMKSHLDTASNSQGQKIYEAKQNDAFISATEENCSCHSLKQSPKQVPNEVTDTTAPAEQIGNRTSEQTEKKASEQREHRTLRQSSSTAHCVIHADQACELLCIACDVFLCMQCKLMGHFHHQSRPLTDTANMATSPLTEDKRWLHKTLKELEKNHEDRISDQRQLKMKKTAVEREILRRHSELVASADRFKNEALAALETNCCDTETTQSKGIEVVEHMLYDLRSLQRRADQAEQRRDSSAIAALAKEIQTQRENKTVEQKLNTVRSLSQISRPVHRSKVSAGSVNLENMKDFIGSGTVVHLEAGLQDFTAVEQFRCDVDDDDTTVFCVCPVQDGTVWVSFHHDRFQNKLPPKRFTESGEVLRTLRGVRNISDPAGRISLKEIPGKKKIIFCLDDNECPSVYSKCLSKNLFKLERFKGKTYIGVTHVFSDHPEPVMGQTQQFSIQCERYRTFDVNITETFFAVVTETPDLHVRGEVSCEVRRDVKLYQRHRYKAFDSYVSPIAPFLPADVCFFVMRGQEVLLVADEYNDVIHVVMVGQDGLTFQHFLCPGSPLLLQPTALNADRQGRIWVGCRGGRLITFQPSP